MELEKILKEKHELFIEESIEKGAKDGDLNIPAKEDLAVSPYEKTIVHKYQAIISDMGIARSEALSSVNEGIISTLKKEKESVTPVVIDTEVEKLDTLEKDDLRKEEEIYLEGVKEIQNSAGFVSADSNKKLGAREFKKVCVKYKREHTDKGGIKPWQMMLLLAFIGLAEVAINFEVFKQFKENLIFTMLMALSLCIAVPYLAHSTGQLIKQLKDKIVGNSIVALLFTLITTGVFWKVADLRLEDETLSSESFYIFLGLSVLLYFVGVYASYNSFDSSKAFYSAYLKNEEVVAVFKKEDEKRAFNLMVIKKTLGENAEQIRNKYNEKRKDARNIVLILTGKVNSAITEHNRVLQQYRQLEERCNSYYHESIQNYRTSNLSRRITPQPTVWAADITDLKMNFPQFKDQV